MIYMIALIEEPEPSGSNTSFLHLGWRLKDPLTIVEASLGFNATGPSDKIYAFRLLLENSLDPSIIPITTVNYAI